MVQSSAYRQKARPRRSSSLSRSSSRMFDKSAGGALRRVVPEARFAATRRSLLPHRLDPTQHQSSLQVAADEPQHPLVLDLARRSERFPACAGTSRGWLLRQPPDDPFPRLRGDKHRERQALTQRAISASWFTRSKNFSRACPREGGGRGSRSTTKRRPPPT